MKSHICSCGYQIEPESLFCENCGKKVENIIEDETDKDLLTKLKDDEIDFDRYKVYLSDPRNKSIESVTKSEHFDIRLGEGEEVIKHFHCSRLKLQRCNGYLTVTNKRVIFRGSGLANRLVKEITISSITGLDTYYGTNINFIFLIIGLILGLMCFNALDTIAYGGFFEDFLFIALFILSALFFKLAIKKTFKMGIYSSSSMLSPINIGLGSMGLASILESNIILASPTSQTDTMMKQLGALIMDIQTQGDFAIEKWKD